MTPIETRSRGFTLIELLVVMSIIATLAGLAIVGVPYYFRQAQKTACASHLADIHKQLIVIDVSEENDQPVVLINPKVLEKRGIEEMEEGCLSFPGVYAKVQRANEIKISALDRHGQPFEIDTGELLAVCIQHELDHIEGKLFVDYLSPLKRDRIRKQLEKKHRRETQDASA